jgi:hypothetical protein
MSQIYNWESKAVKPEEPVNTASAFAQWVFEQSTYYRPKLYFAREKTMQQGIEAHQLIDYFFRYEWPNKLNVASNSASDWIVEHTEQDGTEGKYYKASSLVVNDEPLHCSPDVLLRHKTKSQVIIIERKTTTNKNPIIPAKSWPNVQAQLWCYSWIDSILDVDEVILVNQVWAGFASSYRLSNYHPMWKRDDKEINDKCLIWFELYGGKFIPQV